MAKTQFLAVTGFYFLSVAFVWIFHADSAEAKWIRVRGSSVLSTGLKTSMKYAVRHYSSYSSADIARCANLAQRETGYVCDTDSPIANMPDFNILEIENQIEAAKKRLNFAAGNVDQYSKASVNNYNALVSTYNRLIAEHGKLVEEHNAALERDCVSYANFCKPYDCEKKQS